MTAEVANIPEPLPQQLSQQLQFGALTAPSPSVKRVVQQTAADIDTYMRALALIRSGVRAAKLVYETSATQQALAQNMASASQIILATQTLVQELNILQVIALNYGQEERDRLKKSLALARDALSAAGVLFGVPHNLRVAGFLTLTGGASLGCEMTAASLGWLSLFVGGLYDWHKWRTMKREEREIKAELQTQALPGLQGYKELLDRLSKPVAPELIGSQTPQWRQLNEDLQLWQRIWAIHADVYRVATEKKQAPSDKEEEPIITENREGILVRETAPAAPQMSPIDRYLKLHGFAADRKMLYLSLVRRVLKVATITLGLSLVAAVVAPAVLVPITLTLSIIAATLGIYIIWSARWRKEVEKAPVDLEALRGMLLEGSPEV